MRQMFMVNPLRQMAGAGLAVTLLFSLVLALDGCHVDPAARALKKLKDSHQSLTTDDFIKAAARGDADSLRLFLTAGMDRNAQDSQGCTALMAAAQAGKTEAVKLLLDENAGVDLKDKAGETALILAAAGDQAECVRQLVEANADVTLKDNKNWTALMKAVYSGYTRTVQALLTSSRDRLARDGQLDRALLVASYLGNNEIIIAMLDRGANVNVALDKGQTPLMCAATTGKTDTVKLLLARGADSKAVNSDGATASIIAMQRGFTSLAKMLDSSATGEPGPPAEAETATPAPPPPDQTPTPEQAREKQAAAEAAAGVVLEQTWLKEHHVDPKELAKRDTGQDDDGDGFTNDEELAAGTDPNDPNSHPPYYTKLRMKKLEGEVFPAVFEGIDPKTRSARVSLHTAGGNRAIELEVGDHLPDLPYVVNRIHAREINAKDTGEPMDVSELTLLHVDSGEKLVLVKGLPANAPHSKAVLSLELVSGKAEEIEVTAGQEFTLAIEPKNRYKVVDIRPAQVILRILNTNQVITVEMRDSDATAKR